MSTCRCYNLKVGEKSVYYYIFDNVSQVYINRENKYLPAIDINELCVENQVVHYFATNSQLYLTCDHDIQLFADRDSRHDIKI